MLGNLIKDIGSIIFVIYVFAAAMLFPITLLAFHLEKNESDFFEKRYKLEYEKGTYFFEGALNRQLLDICISKDGNPAVLFKEDCYAETSNN